MKTILHGLYYHREDIDKSSGEPRTAAVAGQCIPCRKGMLELDGKPQSVDAASFRPTFRSKLVTAKLELPLRYLQYPAAYRYNRR